MARRPGEPPSEVIRSRTVPMRATSDAKLMVRIQAGDTRAFELFYDRHVAVALGVAMRILRDRDLAQDAVQDGFVGLWRGRMSYRPHTAAARTWLLVIVSNRAIDVCRRERKRRMVLSGDAPPAACPARDCTEEEAITNADHQELRAQLCKLPSDQRRAIELAYFAGLTHAEIARQLGLPLGTVKGRLRLGRERLGLAVAEGIRRPDDAPQARRPMKASTHTSEGMRAPL